MPADSLRSAGGGAGGPGSIPYFDRNAATWAALYDAPTPGGHALRERRRRVLELLGDAGGDLLDVGCGSAVLAPAVSARGWRFFGVDGASAMMEEGRLNMSGGGGVRGAVANAAALPFRDARFDAVVCIGVLERVPLRDQAVKELVRVLRPGGRAVVSFPNRRSPYTLWNSSVYRPAVGRLKAGVARLLRRPPSVALDSSYVTFSPCDASALFARAGADVVEVAHFQFNLLLSPIDELFPRSAWRAVGRLEGLHASRLAWLGTGFLACAKRRRAGTADG